MDKPVAAIEWMRKNWQVNVEDLNALLNYLDSIPDGSVPVVWPKELTRERLEGYAEYIAQYESDASRALRALAAIAPERKMRVVDLWEHSCGDIFAQESGWSPKPHDVMDWKCCRKRHVELED